VDSDSSERGHFEGFVVTVSAIVGRVSAIVVTVSTIVGGVSTIARNRPMVLKVI